MEIDSCDGWTLWMFLIPLNLKMVKIVDFVLCVFYHSKQLNK